MKNRYKRMNRFNMLEVVLSLIIVLIALVGVMTLLPKSIKTNKSSIDSVNAMDSSEQMLRYLVSYYENNWAALEKTIPSQKSTVDDMSIVWSSETMFDNDSTNTVVFYENNSQENWDSMENTTGVFKLVQKTIQGASDFDSVVRVWKVSTNSVTASASEGGVATSSTASVASEDVDSYMLYAEISWPASKPYELRSKKTVPMQVYKSADATRREMVMVTPGQPSSTGGSVNANIPLNPNSSNKTMEFCAVLIDSEGQEEGSRVSMDDLKDGDVADGDTFYADYVQFRPIGKDFSMAVNGENYTMENGKVFTVSGDLITIEVANESSNGKWELSLMSDNASVDVCSSSSESDCENCFSNTNDVSSSDDGDDSDEVVSSDPTTDPTADPDDDDSDKVDFVVDDDKIVLQEDAKTVVTVLGAAISWGTRYDMKVTTRIYIDVPGSNAEYKTPFGSFDNAISGNVNDGQVHTYKHPELLPKSTVISTQARSWYKKNNSNSGTQSNHWSNFLTVNESNKKQVKILLNGSEVPNIKGAFNQGDILSFMTDYVGTDGRIVLDENQAIILYELGTTNLESSLADFQDLVLLVTFSTQGDAVASDSADTSVEVVEEEETFSPCDGLSAESVYKQGTTLYIVGTDKRDNIVVDPDGKNFKVVANFDENGDKKTVEKKYKSKKIKEVVICAGGGDDYIQAKVKTPQLVYLGDGDDYYQSDEGKQVIYGGAGEDEVQAGSGNDTSYDVEKNQGVENKN
ncbi:MAG: hypothetical protein MK193_09750 [Lentisphaeria bacterium]|nr:hypothetical protein [Lentisphaeria bacterium]